MTRIPKSRKKNKKNNRRSPKPKQISKLNAQNADLHKLYELSVQDTESTVEFLEELFESRQDFTPTTLREDFCGTAALCAKWVASHSERSAVGIDLDKPTLDWGMEQHIAPLGEAASRVSLQHRDVLEQSNRDEFDVIAAFNFSYCVFKQRKVLLSYFRRVHESLKAGGVFILDLHGGPDAQFQLEEPRQVEDFEYVWEQESYDPINNYTLCHISFRFEDGSELLRAFTYDWRHWSMPELRDLLEEAGFGKIDSWWDGDDDEYSIHETATSLEAWVAYLAAWK